MRRLYVGAYAAAVRLLRRLWKSLPVDAVYLRQGLLEPGWVPGASDMDTLWVVPAEPAGGFLRLLDRLARAKKAIPFLGEAEVTDERSLRLYLREGDSKRRDAAAWRRLAGREIPLEAPVAEAPAWRTSWDAWARAAESYELLLKRYLSDENSPASRIAARKHLIDVHRWLRAAAAPGSPAPSRDDAARALREEQGARWTWTARADGFPWAEFPSLLAAALEELDAQGGLAARALPKTVATVPTAPDAAVLDDAWESQAAERRFRRLRETCGAALGAMIWNTQSETAFVLDGPATADWFARFQSVRRPDPGLQGAVSIYTRRAFQNRLWTVRHGTPFPYWSLRAGARPGCWRHSAGPLLGRMFSGRLDGTVGASRGPGLPSAPAVAPDRRMGSDGTDGAWAPPSAPLLDALARQSAANWLMRWRNSLSMTAESPALYRWLLLVTPVLSLRLYFSSGRPSDPWDLPGLLRGYAAAFPAEKSWTAALEGALQADDVEWTLGRMGALFRAQAAGFEKAADGLAAAVH